MFKPIVLETVWFITPRGLLDENIGDLQSLSVPLSKITD